MEKHSIGGEIMFAVFCADRSMDGVFIGTAGSQPESAENAKLIAAAPDLLKALLDIEMETRVGGQWTTAEINEVCRAVISKATK